MENNKQIFRQESLDKISSVDDLDSYIKTTKPSMWIVIGAVIILLAGFIFWAAESELETSTVAGCLIKDGKAIIYVNEESAYHLKDESYFEIDGNKYELVDLRGPYQQNEESDAYLLNAIDYKEGNYYYVINIKELESINPDGYYKGELVFEIVSPIDFILN